MNNEDNSFLKEAVHDFEEMNLQEIDAESLKFKEHEAASLIVKATNELELKFLISLCNTEELERNIEILVPIGNVYKPIGVMEFTFSNLVKIRTYNPKLGLSILTENSTEIQITDEMILVM